ncbi:MAG: type III secretion system export apparatus subunit SctT [Pseudomonadota bacterium]|jgi:type III secretion protein T
MNASDIVRIDPLQLKNLALGLLLVQARLMPMFLLLPMMNRSMVPRTVLFAIAAGFGVLVLPTLQLPADLGKDAPMLLLILGKEALIGLLLGFLLALPFWLFEAIGFIVDNQRGANMAAMLNPLTGSESSPLGLLMNMAFITFYIAIGGMHVLLGVVYDSYKLWDPLQFWPHFDAEFADLVFPQLNRMLQHCLLLAAPAMLVMLLAELSLALISRFTPQLQVFFLAMPIKSALGIFMLAISTGMLLDIAREQMDGGRHWLKWLAPVLHGGA